jgi:hypothetical protein
MLRRAHRLFGRYLILSGVRRVVDKYPELIYRVSYVRELFPDAKFVFITRNGPDVVTSIVKWSERQRITSPYHTDDWWGQNDIKWNYLRHQLILSDQNYVALWPIATADLDHPNRAALEWIVTMREGCAQERQSPESVIRVRYEDLLMNPRDELARLQHRCDLVPDPAVTEYAMHRLHENPTKGPLALHPTINALFQETMNELGYPC